MLVTFDLTSRQLARVLEQAVRNHASFEIEPRTWPENQFLRGAVANRDGNLLRIELDDTHPGSSLTGLIGSFCDVRTVLSGQMYLFSTCVVDVADCGVPRRLVLAAPTMIQLVNRRRFERRSLCGNSPVRVEATGADEAPAGEILDISADGIACRVTGDDLGDVFFVGDEIRVSFELPDRGGSFDLPAIICNKKPAADGQEYTIGLKFTPRQNDSASRGALQRLRGILCEMITGTGNVEGNA